MRGLGNDHRSITLGELVENSVKGLQREDLALGTVKRYTSTYNKHMRDAAISRTRIIDLTTGDLMREIDRLESQGSATSVSPARSLWRRAIRQAVLDGVITHSPDRELGSTRRVERVRPRVESLKEEEVRQLLDLAYSRPTAVRSGLADALALAAQTGLRVGELMGLHWSAIDLDKGLLSVEGKYTRVDGQGLVWENSAKSKLSLRTIPLTPQAIELLSRRYEDADSTLVFPTHSGAPRDVSQATKSVKVIMVAAGMPNVTVHTLRRTVENRLLRSEMPTIDIEVFMGHTDAVSRAAYADRTIVPLSALAALGVRQKDQ